MELKTDMRDYLAWLLRQAEKNLADIRLGTRATADILRATKPDALVIAAGARPIIPDVPGAELPHVHWAADADMGRCAVGDSIVIIGAGSLGLESAVTHTGGGKQVTVLELRESLASAGSDTAELLTILRERGAPILTGRRLTAICPDRVVCAVDATGAVEEHPCGHGAVCGRPCLPARRGGGAAPPPARNRGVYRRGRQTAPFPGRGHPRRFQRRAEHLMGTFPMKYHLTVSIIPLTWCRIL